MNDLKLFYKKYQIYVWPAVTTLVSLLLIFLIVIPQISEYQKTFADIQQVRQEVQTLKTKAEALKQFDEEAYKQYLTIALKSLPSGKDLISSISQVQLLTAKTNTILNDLTVSGDGDPQVKSVQSYSISMSSIGDMVSLSGLINALQDTPRLMRLKSLNLNSTRASNIYDTSANLATYYQAMPTTLGSLDSPVVDLTEEEARLIETINDNFRNLPVVTVEAASGARGKPDPFN